LTLCVDGEQWLIDPGTFTYVGNVDQRNRFRGSGAHNTVRIDGENQAIFAGPFRWDNPPQVSLLRWESSPDEDVVTAVCRYRGLEHYRHVHFAKNAALLIVDLVEGPPGEHKLEQLWHLGDGAQRERFRFPQSPEILSRWRSRCFGQREPATVLRISRKTELPALIPAAICLSESTSVEMVVEPPIVHFHLKAGSGTRLISVNCFDDLR
jgi:hypothetical protein